MSFRNSRGGGRGGRGRGGFGGGNFGARAPKLPATLMAEVESTYGASRQTGARGRKDARKAARKGPPPRERQQDTRPVLSAKAAGKRRASPDEEEEEEADPEPMPARKKAKAEEQKPAKKDKDEEKKKKKKDQKELVLPQDDVDVEDREIAWLEYMLEKEKAGDDDMSDGLDDLLDLAGKMGPGGKGLGRGDISDSDEDDSDMDDDGLGGFLDDLSDDDEGDEDEEEEEFTVFPDSDEEEEGGDKEEEDESADEGDEIDLSEDEDETPSKEPTPAPEPAAEAALEAATTGRYLPPHLRAAALAEKAAGDSARAQERAKLERKAQGLLNKLSEANIESILAEVEKLFGEYSRNDVTTTLTAQVMQMIGSKTNLLDSFVVLYATLVGALHRVVGLEFGAHFVQTLVKKYTDMSAKAEVEEAENDENEAFKEAHNLLTLIAEMYNAGVVGSGLVFDLVRGFIGEGTMGERSVEGLLKILKCCGSQLRADDTASLKDIVALVQERTRGKDKEMTTRARFMVETLVALQSGKKKGLGAEREDVARMRKFLSGLGKKRRLLAPEPIRVGLADLLSADSRGKWWLVGAGWSGNPLVERGNAITVGKEKKKPKAKAEQEDEEVLLELARKQGMNTDVRRSVFVTLLTSEDYQHACDRLNAFRLTQVQQREFVRVTLHCCGMEGAYNPYYTLVLNNLCANSYDHRFTLQYALWDMLRELGEGAVSDTRASHVARALAFCFGRSSVDITILKAVEFTDLSKSSRKFLETLIRSTLLATQTASPLLTLPRGFNVEADVDTEVTQEIFAKALAAPELAGGLAWVMQGIKKSHGKGVGEREGEVVRMCAEAALEVLAKAV